MFREVIIKLAGATLLLFGIGVFVFGVLLGIKFMQATGFISSMISVVLLYYSWATSNGRPMEEEPHEMISAAK
jgi:membrane protein implicated in regulation of membrane protease activity